MYLNLSKLYIRYVEIFPVQLQWSLKAEIVPKTVFWCQGRVKEFFLEPTLCTKGKVEEAEIPVAIHYYNVATRNSVFLVRLLLFSQELPLSC